MGNCGIMMVYSLAENNQEDKEKNYLWQYRMSHHACLLLKRKMSVCQQHCLLKSMTFSLGRKRTPTISFSVADFNSMIEQIFVCLFYTLKFVIQNLCKSFLSSFSSSSPLE